MSERRKPTATEAAIKITRLLATMSKAEAAALVRFVSEAEHSDVNTARRVLSQFGALDDEARAIALKILQPEFGGGE